MPARKKPSSPVTVHSAGAEAKPAVDAFTDTLHALKRKMEENLDQLALVQGVLEELCERQEALAAWQMEFAKRTVSLGEAQWKALEGLAGQSAFAGFRSKADLLTAHKKAAAEASSSEAPFVDSLDEATDFLGGLSADLARRREVRSRVHAERATNRRRTSEGAKPTRKGAKSSARVEGGEPEATSPGEALESILVLPEKTDFH